MALAEVFGRFGRGSAGACRVPGIAATCYRKSNLAARIFMSMRFGLTDRNYRNAGGEFNRRMVSLTEF